MIEVKKNKVTVKHDFIDKNTMENVSINFTLTDNEVEDIFRYKRHQYDIEDLFNHMNEYLDKSNYIKFLNDYTITEHVKILDHLANASRDLIEDNVPWENAVEQVLKDFNNALSTGENIINYIPAF